MEDRRSSSDRRLGRPRLTPERRKRDKLNFRMTQDEIDLLYRIAHAGRTTVTELWRQHVKSLIAASSSLLNR